MILTLFTAMITLLTAPADTPAVQASPAQLTGIGYSVKEGRSRLSFRCTASIPPQVEELGQKVVLHFAGMTVAPRPGEATLPFSDGDIASVAIRKEGASGLRVVVDLRSPGLTCTVSPNPAGSILIVATPGRTGKSDVLSAGTRNPVAGAMAAPVPSLLTSVSAVEAKKASSEGSGLSIPAMMLAVLVSTVSTAMVLFGLRRRNRQLKSGGLPVHPDVPSYDEPAEDENNEEAGLTAWRDEDPPAAEPEEELPPEYAEAMTFRRMRAEVGLARTMNGAVVSRRKAEELRSLAGGDGNPEVLKTARRLGVGRGEIALATRLSMLRTREPATEEVQQ